MYDIIYDILKQYWGFENFRTPQKEIIESVLSGKDTIGIMPTGGGKSLCFQIPGMAAEGICLVISPLIALMKDQTDSLINRNIKALSLTGGLSHDEIVTVFDNCMYGNYKFLYMSPERLQQEWIVEKLKNLPINLIAIDEAHCVSQWGHDFRPAFLKIKNLKQYFQRVPFLALTATATERVQQDIIEQLGLKEPVVFKKSFERKNIQYANIKTEDKLFKIEQILKKHPEPSIIYVRNRRACHEISTELGKRGFSATFYHGGLPLKDKEKNMQNWMKERALVMVATNAFGMGIDKPNVRTVIHVQIPENLENYYQEAGRAGRDGEESYTTLLYSLSDENMAKSQFLYSLPDKDFLKTVYIKLCNYFKIAYGEGFSETFKFNLHEFCVHYQLPVIKTYNSILFLDRQGVLYFEQDYSEKISLQFLIENKEIIRYMSLNPTDEEIILAILRTYPGIYGVSTALNLPLIAKKSGKTTAEVETVLKRLDSKQIVSYSSANNDASITFLEIREDDRTINRIIKHLHAQNNLKKEQLESVMQYVFTPKTCLNKFILNYFGEKKENNCGKCSECQKTKGFPNKNDNPEKTITEILKKHPASSRELMEKLRIEENVLIFTLRKLLDEKQIKIQSDNRYTTV
ncbi:MAG: ATP-dependent DNA helicase RecQ [Flavobacteriaceae bacterium]|jgi:ATP-dependent DNA helicase RecQ|nr:ATP-dependent DNA helicase RecQ [Flavobacteriaceae bacterium]